MSCWCDFRLLTSSALYKETAMKPVFFTDDRAIVARVLGRFSAVDKSALANMIARAFGP